MPLRDMKSVEQATSIERRMSQQFTYQVTGDVTKMTHAAGRRWREGMANTSWRLLRARQLATVTGLSSHYVTIRLFITATYDTSAIGGRDTAGVVIRRRLLVVTWHGDVNCSREFTIPKRR